MPQMAPMWWTTIMIMSLISLMLMMVCVYFNKKTKDNSTKINNYKEFYWKW